MGSSNWLSSTLGHIGDYFLQNVWYGITWLVPTYSRTKLSGSLMIILFCVNKYISSCSHVIAANYHTNVYEQIHTSIQLDTPMKNFAAKTYIIVANAIIVMTYCTLLSTAYFNYNNVNCLNRYNVFSTWFVV